MHNGTLANHISLRKMLENKGHVFTSQTDSEVIAKLIGDFYESSPEIRLDEAVSAALSQCIGTWVCGARGVHC